MRKARIKENAPEQFYKESVKIFKGGLPKTYLEFHQTLKKWAGKMLEVEKEYDDRVFLKYPNPVEENGYKIVGIDLEKKFVEFVE